MPIALLNPYVAGGLFVDYLVRGRYPVLPEHPLVLTPDHLSSLTSAAVAAQNPDSAGAREPAITADNFTPLPADAEPIPGMKEIVDTHE